MRDDEIAQGLMADGLVDRLQIQAAHAERANFGGTLAENLQKLGFVSEIDLVRWMSGRLKVPWVNLEGKPLDPALADVLPTVLAEKYHCVPLRQDRLGTVTTLYVGMSDPSDVAALDDMSFSTGVIVRPVLAGPNQVSAALEALRRGEHGPLVVGEVKPAIGSAVELPKGKGAKAPPNGGSRRMLVRGVVATLVERGIVTREELIDAVKALPKR
jgi:hypothetical protein